MPISRKYFELGINEDIAEWMKKIHSFLTEHKDTAFTRDELWKEVFDKPSWLTMEGQAYNEALDKLVDLKVVVTRSITPNRYYSVGHERLPI